MNLPLVFAAGTEGLSLILIEIGAVIVGMALLARFARRWGFSAIPLYLLAGLAFGDGGLLPLDMSAGFSQISAEIGVVLLLFLLGLEYTGEELGANLRSGLLPGFVDLAANFTPGFLAGWLLGWGMLAALVLGGVTYISSSGVITKVLSELGRKNYPETRAIISILVLEDLVMAVYLPLISVLLLGQALSVGAISVAVALVTVAVVLFVAVRYGRAISRVLSHPSDEIVLLTTFGLVLLVSGIAQRLQISAAVGAFLVGIALSETMAERAYRLLKPLRDLFASVFFFFFGMQVNPGALPPVLLLAILLGLVTAATKVFTGRWAARRAGNDDAAGWRAGAALVARGEFSIVIAGIGVAAGLTPQLGALSAAYVLLMAILGPILARLAPAIPRENSK